jgi:hypothetical protein
MESTKNTHKRTKASTEDQMMSSTTTDKSELRVIKKAKRRVNEEKPLVDEDGEEISFEEDSEELEANKKAVYMDEQEVVQQDSDEWDDDEDMEEVDLKKEAKKKKNVDEEDMEAEEADKVDELPKQGIWND